MSTSESSAAKNNRRHPSRVNLTTRVFTEDAYEEREVAFVVGVLGSFSGNLKEPEDSVAQRDFVNVRPDNFDDVLKGMQPGVVAEVPNTLQNDGSKLQVKLSFDRFTDFQPDALVQKVPELAELHKTRVRLKELRARLSGNTEWRKALQDALKDERSIQQLKRDLESGE